MKRDEKKQTETHRDDLEAFEEFDAPEEEIVEPAAKQETIVMQDEDEEQGEKAAPVDPLDLAPDVPVQLIAVMAKKMITVADLLEFRQGHVIDLNRPPSEMVDLVANGKLIARGELVEIDGKLGVKVVKLVHA